MVGFIRSSLSEVAQLVPDRSSHAAALIARFAVATVGNLTIRWLFPGYSTVEKTMVFSFGMLVARLTGAACVAVARNARAAAYLFAVLLLALFVPVHFNLGAKFPPWHHFVFLGSLIPLVVFGARLHASRGGQCGLTLRSTGRAGSYLLSGERLVGAPVTFNVGRLTYDNRKHIAAKTASKRLFRPTLRRPRCHRYKLLHERRRAQWTNRLAATRGRSCQRPALP